jgi:hypothetical protein
VIVISETDPKIALEAGKKNPATLRMLLLSEKSLQYLPCPVEVIAR